MNKYDWFFLQPVTEGEMSDAFQAVENAIDSITSDQGLVGIFSGMGGGPTTPVNTMRVIVSAGAAYDAVGQRIIVGSPYEFVDCSVDYMAVPTTVSGGGNEKWLAVFAKFTRVQSIPRTDGNGNTIQYDDFESHQLVVVQGNQNTIGLAVKPTLDPTMVLLFDVHLISGQMSIASGDMDATRRQDVFNIAGSPFSVRGGTLSDAAGSLLTDLNTHVAGSVGAHPDTAISSANTTGDSPYNLPGTTVRAQLLALNANLNTTAGDLAAVVAEIGAVSGIAPLDSASYVPNVNVHGGLLAWNYGNSWGSQTISTTIGTGGFTWEAMPNGPMWTTGIMPGGSLIEYACSFSIFGDAAAVQASVQLLVDGVAASRQVLVQTATSNSTLNVSQVALVIPGSPGAHTLSWRWSTLDSATHWTIIPLDSYYKIYHP